MYIILTCQNKLIHIAIHLVHYKNDPGLSSRAATGETSSGCVTHLIGTGGGLLVGFHAGFGGSVDLPGSPIVEGVLHHTCVQSKY